MDIRQLEYFKEIVDQGSISKAAHSLHIAQPPLSQLLKKLEEELGSILIRRYREKWELTETGGLLYRYAAETIYQRRDVKERIREIEEGTGGTLHLGVSIACSHLVLPFIESFRTRFPHVKLNILTGNSEYLLEKLEQREIETAVLLRPANSDPYAITPLDIPSSVTVVPERWKEEFETGEVTFEKLAAYPYIMLGSMEGYSFYENITAAFREYDLEPNVVMECKDIHMVVSLIRKGMGVSILPKMDDAASLFENTSFFELEGYRFGVEPVVIGRKGERRSKVAERFSEVVEERRTSKGDG